MLIPVLGAAATLAGGALSAFGQADANEENAKQAQLNRDFQERMSNTAWQRGVADMKAAGLNPALAYERGGASAPSGGTANMQNTLAGAAGTAQGAASIFNQGVAQASAIANQTANTEKIISETKDLDLQRAIKLTLLQAQADSLSAGTALTRQRKLSEEHNTQGAYFRSKLDEQELDYRSRTNPIGVKIAQLGLDRADATQKALIDRVLADSEAAQLGLPAMRNEARFAESLLGKYVAPALGTARGVVGVLDDIKSLRPPRIPTRRRTHRLGPDGRASWTESWDEYE